MYKHILAIRGRNVRLLSKHLTTNIQICSLPLTEYVPCKIAKRCFSSSSSLHRSSKKKNLCQPNGFRGRHYHQYYNIFSSGSVTRSFTLPISQTTHSTVISVAGILRSTFATFTSSNSYYDILGVTKDVSDPELKKAYFKQAKKWHPDLCKDDPNAKANFQKINEAYSILKDKSKRQEYDNMQANKTYGKFSAPMFLTHF